MLNINIFFSNLIVRILLIFFLGFVAFYIALNTYFWLVSIWIGIAVVFLIYDLVGKVNNTKLDLSEFMNSISNNDFSNIYSINILNNADHELQKAYKQILKTFLNLRAQKEANFQYINTIINQIDTSLISFEKNGKVHFCNKAFEQLFNRSGFYNIKDIKIINKNLFKRIIDVKPEGNFTIKFEYLNKNYHLSVHMSTLIMDDVNHKVVTLRDIKNELEILEVESWQKLLRIVSHEITNSAIPISNLSGVTLKMLKDKYESEGSLNLEEDNLKDLFVCLETIENRSKGLVNFVNATKSLTRIPSPNFQKIIIKDLLYRVVNLLKPKFSQQKIFPVIKILSDKSFINADLELIEQVLINLIFNALEAVKKIKDPEIQLFCIIDKNKHVSIQVKDNGIGIKKIDLDNIFVPFYTTRKSGSGIGLSLSRKIMKLHNSNISVNSEPGKGSCFSLVFYQ